METLTFREGREKGVLISRMPSGKIVLIQQGVRLPAGFKAGVPFQCELVEREKVWLARPIRACPLWEAEEQARQAREAEEQALRQRTAALEAIYMGFRDTPDAIPDGWTFDMDACWRCAFRLWFVHTETGTRFERIMERDALAKRRWFTVSEDGENLLLYGGRYELETWSSAGDSIREFWAYLTPEETALVRRGIASLQAKELGDPCVYAAKWKTNGWLGVFPDARTVAWVRFQATPRAAELGLIRVEAWTPSWRVEAVKSELSNHEDSNGKLMWTAGHPAYSLRKIRQGFGIRREPAVPLKDLRDRLYAAHHREFVPVTGDLWVVDLYREKTVPMGWTPLLEDLFGDVTEPTPPDTYHYNASPEWVTAFRAEIVRLWEERRALWEVTVAEHTAQIESIIQAARSEESA